MKTRKNILFLILGISVIAIALIVFLILRNKPDIGNGTGAVSLQKNQTAANDGITTITYAIPDFCVINLNNVKFLKGNQDRIFVRKKPVRDHGGSKVHYI